MENIIVSIFLITYNQEKFIGQTIQSILEQQIHFSYQLVIGEDCSTDNTRRICEKYASKYPEKIKLLPSERNLGLIQNFIRTYKDCDGKYVAICDGDDYWTDPLKLQKQVDFLENNPDYGIVFTSFNFLFTDGRIIEKDYSIQNSTTTFKDLIFGNYISSVTAVFRNKSAADDFPEWLGSCPYGDWPLYLWTTRDGAKIKYLDEVTAVYRREIGVSEKMKLVPSSISKENLSILKNISRDFNFRSFHKQIKESLKAHHEQLLACYIRESRYLKSFILSIKLILNNPSSVFRLYTYLLKKKLYGNFKSFTRYSRQNLSKLLGHNSFYNRYVFQEIFEKDLFNKVPIADRSASKSGPGSSLQQTEEIIIQLPSIFKKYDITSVLDIPCGDFYWMRKVDLSDIDYTGGDIVPGIIKGNKRFSCSNIKFRKIDILNDPLPKVDLIFCRDLFVHLTYEQIYRAIENIKGSGSKYLLTTSYKSRQINMDISEIGRWRPLNMEIAPFFISKPVEEIFENCSEGNMSFNDKYMLLFEIKALPGKNEYKNIPF